MFLFLTLYRTRLDPENGYACQHFWMSRSANDLVALGSVTSVLQLHPRRLPSHPSLSTEEIIGRLLVEPEREKSEETQVDINLSDVLFCFYFKLINVYNFLEFFNS